MFSPRLIFCCLQRIKQYNKSGRVNTDEEKEGKQVKGNYLILVFLCSSLRAFCFYCVSKNECHFYMNAVLRTCVMSMKVYGLKFFKGPILKFGLSSSLSLRNEKCGGSSFGTSEWSLNHTPIPPVDRK